jgi:hypothetical protein
LTITKMTTTITTASSISLSSEVETMTVCQRTVTDGYNRRFGATAPEHLSFRFPKHPL